MIPTMPTITIATKIMPATKVSSLLNVPIIKPRNARPSPTINNFCTPVLRANFLINDCRVII